MSLKPYSTLIDFITGKEVPNVGAEENRQRVERYLVEQKGYLREDVAVDADIVLSIKGEVYRSQVDLVVKAASGPEPAMVVKCCAGSPASREREILAAARLLGDAQIPVAVVSDGRTAIVLDAISGKRIGSGMEAIPHRTAAAEKLASMKPETLSPERREKEKLIFRTYDRDNVNVGRKL